MKKKIMAIVDEEINYIRQMGAYLSQQGFSTFQIMTFTELDSFLTFCGIEGDGSDDIGGRGGRHEITILLMGEKTFGKLLKRKPPKQYFGVEKPLTLPVGKMMVLQEEGALLPEQLQMNGNPVECIYKYQSMNSLCAEVMERFARDESCKGVMTGSRKKTRIAAVYTPGGDVWNSVAAVTLGQVLAEKEKVFLLNLQLYGSLYQWFEERNQPEGDLSDLIYFLRNQKEKLLFKLEGMKGIVNGLEYIHPIPFAEDLLQIPKEEWLDFLHNLCYTSDYDVIILDLSDGVNGLQELLLESDELYTISRENIVSQSKWQMFMEWCNRNGESELEESFQKIPISESYPIPNRAAAVIQHPLATDLRRMAAV